MTTATATTNTILNGKVATLHAVIYDRASTRLQKDNFSRVNAKEYGIKVAQQNGFTWEYVKEIGSGTTLTGRPEMMKILDRIAAGEIQILIVQELDRLARPEEPVVYSTIRNTIMEYGVIIHTHTSRVDLNNDDDDFVADITMSVAKKERRRILKRVKRGMKSRAESGKLPAGRPAIGYTIEGQGTEGDLAIDLKAAKIVEAVFNCLDEEGGNLRATVKRVNAMGHTSNRGKPFTVNAIKRIACRKLYIGIFESSVTDKVTHRPDLQIIGLEQFKRVNAMIEKRSDKSKNPEGVRGRYIFTGFVTCETCGGSMGASYNRHRGYVVYQCINWRNYGKAACSKPKTYSEHLILPPIVEFLAEFMLDQLATFHTALNDAAAHYGKSVTEEALESAVQGELASVQAGKQRIVEAISLGVMTNEEAAQKLTELREKEQRLTVEVATIKEKAVIMAEWQQALETVKDKDKNEIATRLYYLAENKPVTFRRLLSLIFAPNSLQVRTKRMKGSNNWQGIFEGYQLTEAIIDMAKECKSFVTNSGVYVI